MQSKFTIGRKNKSISKFLEERKITNESIQRLAAMGAAVHDDGVGFGDWSKYIF